MRRFVLVSLAVVFILGPIVFLTMALEGSPAIDDNPIVGTRDAARTKSALVKLRYVLDPDVSGNRYTISQAEMNSALAVIARGLPFLRGRASVSSNKVVLMLSAQVPNPVTDVWLNLSISVAPSRDHLDLEAVELGGLDVPAGVFLAILRFTTNAMLGKNVADTAIDGVDQVLVQGKTVLVGIKLTQQERRVLLAKGKEFFHAFSPFDDPQTVRFYYGALDEAAYDGRLPAYGPFFPYLRFAFDLAEERAAQGDPLKEIKSAIFALAIYCGHWRVQYLVGKVITSDLKRLSKCRDATLGGRRDLRQHFIISAALEVASKSGLSFSIGEFKELVDSNWRGSGFSFEDLAANRAGIHFAERMLEAATAETKRQALFDKMVSETAIFPDISGLPETMSDAEFKQRFDNIKSPRYRDVLSMIDQRIRGLAFYAGN